MNVFGSKHSLVFQDGCGLKTCKINVFGSKHSLVFQDGCKAVNTSLFLEKGTGENTISFGKNCTLENCSFCIPGSNNQILIKDACTLKGLGIYMLGEGNTIELGENVIVNGEEGATVINAVGGRRISIGQGAMLSSNIGIHTSDYHGIYDQTGSRINPDKDITIGKSVWIGMRCIILKGSFIADGSIVGANSLVSGVFEEGNVIIAGDPAKVIRRRVFWGMERRDTYPVPEGLKENGGCDCALEAPTQSPAAGHCANCQTRPGSILMDKR